MNNFYSYNKETRRYIGSYPLTPEILDPVNKAAQPDNTLSFAPERPAKVNEVVLVNAAYDDWEYVADYTGKVYQKSDGQPAEQAEFGELSDHLTHIKPETQWDQWSEEDQKWVKDLELEKQFYLDQTYLKLQQERDSRRGKGFSFQGHTIEAREKDQSNIVAILTGYSEGVRAAETAVNWKVGINVYLTLNGKAEAVALATAMDQFVQQLFQIEGQLTHQVSSMTTEELKSFNVSDAFEEALKQLS